MESTPMWTFGMLIAFIIGVQQLAFGLADMPGGRASRWTGGLLLGGSTVAFVAMLVLS